MLTCSVLCLMISTNLFSQSDAAKRSYIQSQMINPRDPFDKISKTAHDYFNSLNEQNSTEEDEELEEFYTRWEIFTRDRVGYPDSKVGGDILGARTQALSTFNIAPRCTTGSSLWSSEGPNNSNYCNMGIIPAIAFDPSNPNVFYAGSNTSGLFKTTNGGVNWTNITDNFNLAVAGIGGLAVDPSNSSHIFAGMTAGAFHDGISGIGIIESTNGGISWTQVTLPGLTQNHGSIRKIVYASTNIIYAISDIKIYKSTDNGITWNDITPTIGPISMMTTGYPATIGSYVTTAYNHLIDIEIDNTNSNNIFISTDTYTHYFGSKLFGSTDGGSTWSQITLNSSAVWDAVSIDFTPNDPGTLYVYYTENTGTAVSPSINGVLDKTSNFGTTWTNVYNDPGNGIGFSFWTHVFEMSNNSNNFYLGGLTVHKYTSTGIGYSDTQVTQYFSDTAPYQTHGDIRSIVIRSNGANDELLVGCDGGVIMSSNNGNNGSWLNKNGTGLNISQFYSFSSFNRNTNIVATPQDDWTKIKNAGIWQFAPASGNNSGEAYWAETDYADNNTVYISGNNGLISKSTNGGLNFNSIGAPGGWRGGGKLYIDPTNHNYLYSAVTSNSNLYRWNNLTNTWTLIHTPIGGLQTAPCGGGAINISPVAAVAIAPSNSNVIYEAHEGNSWGCYNSTFLYRSIDGGATWTDITANLNGVIFWTGIKHIIIDPFNEKRIFICFNGYWNNSTNTSQGENRVLVSTDGGNTFSDMSNGLSPAPVNYLAYQNGTDDIIYAATDYGVFRWNKSLGTWECFNQGMPPTITTKLEINYCQNKIYASTYGRGMYSCSLPPVPDFKITTSYVGAINGTNTLTIPSSYFQTFGNRIILDQGVYLKMNGTWNFTAGQSGFPSDFVINKKAHAVVTGTLSTECPQLWSGVQVGGDYYNNQSYSGGFGVYQGILEVLNGGTIKNANNAITTGTYDASYNLDWSSLGGVISCANAYFINNIRDVQFLTYPFYNRSKFINCKFETNALLLGGAIPSTHVSLWDVNNVTFAGNDFRYTAGSAYPYGNRGFGIYSIDANYKVTSACLSGIYPCSTPKRGTFNDLDVGIEVANSNPIQSILVNEVDFNNNYTDGARIGGVNYLTFVNNKINVGTPSSTNPSGLYLDKSRYYSVQNNIITTSFVGSTKGIYATSAKTGAHTIYRNTITGVDVGVASQNDNSGDNNYSDGLKIRCNTFNSGVSNNYDIAMLGDGTIGDNPSVAFFQGQSVVGNPSLLVGNRYAASCGSENRWYVDNTYNIKGALHASQNNPFCLITPQPNCSDPVIIPNIGSASFLSTHCPDNYIVKTKTQINTNLSTARAAFTSTSNVYNALIDGGNTQNLLNAINGTMSNGNLKNLLETSSPYLSDQVLTAYISKVGIPNGHIKDIHNKNKPVSKSVWQVLLSKNLPIGIMNDINQQQANKAISDRTILEGKLSEVNFNLELAYIDKINYFLQDSLPNSKDSALLTIRNANFKDAICQYVAGSAATANTTLTAGGIDALHGGAANVDGFCKFQKIILQLNQTTQKIFSLKTDVNTKGQVESIAIDPNNPAQKQAQALLQKVFGTTHDVLRLSPKVNANRLFNSANSNENNITLDIDNSKSLLIYPNPASNNFNVLLKSESLDLLDDYQLEVLDAMGQKIISKTLLINSILEMDARNLSNGVYLISLSKNNKLITQTKLVIVK
jgi:photosystem II stability/assembly factor-like uncharacterized protein